MHPINLTEQWRKTALYDTIKDGGVSVRVWDNVAASDHKRADRSPIIWLQTAN